jgi:hypothetical protein
MKEVYASVRYYGIGKIIRDYCGFPYYLPLPVSVQHGWYYWAIKHDAIKHASENWYWSKDIEHKHSKAFNYIRTRTVGSPFLYLLELMRYTELPFNMRKGSIVFPAHSASYIRAVFDYEVYANLLDQLPDIYKPITVCIYYLDIKSGVAQPFIKKGFTVVSNGNSLYDEDFLLKFVNNAKDKRYALANDRTSALLYASAMGLRAYYYGPQVKHFVDNEKISEDIIRDENYNYLLEEEKWKSHFVFPDFDEKIQRDYCFNILGKKNLLPRRKMKFLLFRLLFNWRYIYMMLNIILNKIRTISKHN